MTDRQTDVPVDDRIKPQDTFGRWTVLEYAGKLRATAPSGSRSVADRWKCRCACGAECVVFRGNLLGGHTKQCKTCFTGELARASRLQADPDSRRQNVTASGKYRRVLKEGCVAEWDWRTFLAWFRTLGSDVDGVPCRKDDTKPHGPDNTYFVRNPIRESHLAVIAAETGMTESAVREWSLSVSRQAIEQRANLLREKRAKSV